MNLWQSSLETKRHIMSNECMLLFILNFSIPLEPLMSLNLHLILSYVLGLSVCLVLKFQKSQSNISLWDFILKNISGPFKTTNFTIGFMCLVILASKKLPCEKRNEQMEE